MIIVRPYLSLQTADLLAAELRIWQDWQPFPYMDEGSNPWTCWWGFEWLPEAGGLTPIPEKACPPITTMIAARFGANAVQANWHREGVPDLGVPMHTDLHPWLVPLQPGLDSATVSVGAERTLLTAPGDAPVGEATFGVQQTREQTLTHGSLTTYAEGAHAAWLHGVAPGDGERFSVQFRRYVNPDPEVEVDP